MSERIQLIGIDYSKNNTKDEFESRYKEYKVDGATGERIRYVNIDKSIFQKTEAEKQELKRRKAICKGISKRNS